MTEAEFKTLSARLTRLRAAEAQATAELKVLTRQRDELLAEVRKTWGVKDVEDLARVIAREEAAVAEAMKAADVALTAAGF